MDQEVSFKAKYRSSPNIAWVKYWGKYDEDYILPINDSLGLTLNTHDICTQTEIIFSSQNPADMLELNGQQHKLSNRVIKMFSKIKQTVFERKMKGKISANIWEKCHFYVKSVNSFPTASGMASSASGLACLAAALNGLFDNVLNGDELSELARLGSGSASRSICGGLVRWTGVPRNVLSGQIQKTDELLRDLSKKCISQTVLGAEQLKEIKVVILLANDKKKEVSSTSGMQHSVNSSELIQYRNHIAQNRIQRILSNFDKMKKASNEPEKQSLFNDIAIEIIKDSNQFHAICLDTYPPIFYLNEFSKQIMTIVDQTLNKILQYKVAYTFDAGPHAFLFMHQSVVQPVLAYLYRTFSISKDSLNQRARSNLNPEAGTEFPNFVGQVIQPTAIWLTEVGEGCSPIKL